MAISVAKFTNKNLHVTVFNFGSLQILVKVKEETNYNHYPMNYAYRLLSAGKLDVALKILRTVGKSAHPDYHEPVGFMVLEMVKQLRNGPNAIQNIERILEVGIC